MYRLYPLIFFALFLCVNAFAQKKASTNYAMDIRIPSAWIEKVRRYNYKDNNAAILKEFDNLIKPRSVYVPDFDKDLDKNKSGLLNPIFADLDGEAGEELICILAWDKNYPSMAVFKKTGSNWHLLYLEDYYMFYREPDLYVANNYSKNKTFYLRTVYNRGSGIFSDGYKFYKLINNKVYCCLETVHESHIAGFQLYINYEVSSEVQFDGLKDDQIIIDYTYNFMGASDGSGNEYIDLINGKAGVAYKWNDKSKRYLLDIPTYQGYYGLTAAQVACLGNLGDDKLFIRAFQKEINDKLGSGTAQQKKVLAHYLAKAKKEKRVVVDDWQR